MNNDLIVSLINDENISKKYLEYEQLINIYMEKRLPVSEIKTTTQANEEMENTIKAVQNINKILDILNHFYTYYKYLLDKEQRENNFKKLTLDVRFDEQNTESKKNSYRKDYDNMKDLTIQNMMKEPNEQYETHMYGLNYIKYVMDSYGRIKDNVMMIHFAVKKKYEGNGA